MCFRKIYSERVHKNYRLAYNFQANITKEANARRVSMGKELSIICFTLMFHMKVSDKLNPDSVQILTLPEVSQCFMVNA